MKTSLRKKHKHDTSSSESEENSKIKKRKSCSKKKIHSSKHKLKKSRHRSTSSDSSSSEDSSTSSSTDTSSSSTSEEERKRRKKQKQRKKQKKKLKQQVVDKEKNVEDGPSNDIPLELMENNRRMAPMTKEEWEKKQNVVRRVYDETTGRNRLIKGDGEVIEEIVSRDRHKQINQEATKGDGEYFQKHSKNI